MFARTSCRCAVVETLEGRQLFADVLGAAVAIPTSPFIQTHRVAVTGTPVTPTTFSSKLGTFTAKVGNVALGTFSNVQVQQRYAADPFRAIATTPPVEVQAPAVTMSAAQVRANQYATLVAMQQMRQTMNTAQHDAAVRIISAIRA